MTRQVFLSFAYDDIKNVKVNVVRNSWLLKNMELPFIDDSARQRSKNKCDAFLKNLIETGLTSICVTVVLFGEDTANICWVSEKS